jgi:hypothetical protein
MATTIGTRFWSTAVRNSESMPEESGAVAGNAVPTPATRIARMAVFFMTCLSFGLANLT